MRVPDVRVRICVHVRVCIRVCCLGRTQDHKGLTAWHHAAEFVDLQRYLKKFELGNTGPVVSKLGHANPLRMCKCVLRRRGCWKNGGCLPTVVSAGTARGCCVKLMVEEGGGGAINS